MSVAKKNSQYVFTWNIQNFTCLYQENGDKIVSPAFEIENLRGKQWFLHFYPKGDSIDSDFITYSLAMNEPSDNELTTIEFILEIIGEHSIIEERYMGETEFHKDAYVWGFTLITTMDALMREAEHWKEDTLTLRCRIKNDTVRELSVNTAEALSSINVERCFVDWDVKLPISFTTSESIQVSFLKFCHFKISLASMLEDVEIFIHLKDCSPELPERQLTFAITLINQLGCKILSRRSRCLFTSTNTWNYLNFISKEDLEVCKADNSHYEFKLKCELYSSRGTIFSESAQRFTFVSYNGVEPACKNNAISSMQNDFGSLYSTKEYSDVTIRLENVEIPAHKLVLQVRSPVFAAMFEQDMLENETDVVEILDIDIETMEQFLQYLYTETVNELDYESAKKLLIVADKYEVQSLIRKCAFFLTSILTIENACEIIEIGDLVNCETLKYNALRFIKHNSGQVLQSPAWSKLIESNLNVATYVLSELSTVVT